MLKADYAEIAPKYDRTRARREIRRDSDLSALVESASLPVHALDIGCGTGNYLKAQIDAFGAGVRWCGLDLSADMLGVAGRKLPSTVCLARGSAEALPFATAAFDFVALSAVFHHFADKDQALSEIVRCVRPGGCIHLRNGAYEYRSKFWVYRFFPETVEIDRARFWKVDRLIDALEERGARTKATVTCYKYAEAKAELLLWAENRDLSQLALLDDDAYQAGLRALRAEPGEHIRTEYANVDISAVVS